MLREDGQVKAEAEIRVMRLYAEERQGALAAPGSWKAPAGPPLEPPQGSQP